MDRDKLAEKAVKHYFEASRDANNNLIADVLVPVSRDDHDQCHENGKQIAAALNATAREARLVEALEFVIAKGTGHLGGCRCDACQIFDEATAALAEYRGEK